MASGRSSDIDTQLKSWQWLRFIYVCVKAVWIGPRKHVTVKKKNEKKPKTGLISIDSQRCLICRCWKWNIWAGFKFRIRPLNSVSLSNFWAFVLLTSGCPNPLNGLPTFLSASALFTISLFLDFQDPLYKKKVMAISTVPYWF